MDYQNNSNAKKEQAEEKKITPVTTDVKTKKKKPISKFADSFLSDDLESVKSYVLLDVLIPSIKQAVADVIKNGIDAIFYGESSERYSGGNQPRKSYQKIYDNTNNRRNTRTRADLYDFEDILFNNRGDADRVLAQMDELIDRFEVASVNDYYEYVGITGNYTDYKYGWTDLRTASVVRNRDGSYMIKMPRALPIN